MTVQLFYSVFETPAGWIGVLGSPEGLRRTTLPQSSQEAALSLLGNNSSGGVKQSSHRFTDLEKRFQSYFAGKIVDFPDNLDFSEATSFQRRVWQAARQIPFGQTRSYAWIASQAGKPGAARAAGEGLGKNPLPLIVPWHRVLSANGGLGGFGGGLAMKEFLLKLEKTASAE